MAEELKIVVTADTRQAVSGMKRLTNSTKIAIAAIGVAAIALGTKAVKSAVDFGRAMAEVSTITDDTEAQTAALTEQVKEMSSVMGVDATQTARGLYQTISAGVTDSTDAMNLLEVATKASIGGLTNQETAVDALTTVINAYGLSVDQADDVADTFFTTVKLGKTRFDELAGTIGRVVPIAATAGISFEEVGSALVGMTKQGLSTEVASTALRATLTSLLQPTQKVKKLANELGIELGLQALKGKGLTGMLEILSDLYKKNEEDVVALFPNVRALTGVLALTGEASEEFGEAMDEMTKKQGAANTAFEKMNKSAARQFELFQSKLNIELIDLGTKILPEILPLMKDLGSSMAGVAQTVIDLSKVLALPLKFFVKYGEVIGKLSGTTWALAKAFEALGIIKLPETAGLAGAVGAPVGAAITPEQIAAARAQRGMPTTTINTGANYFQTKDPRDRMEEGAFSRKVAS